MTPSDTNKTDSTEIEQLLRDFNGYDFCERNECPGQAKANELIKYLETIITQRCIEELENFTYCGAEKWEIDAHIKYLKEKDTTVT